MNITSIDIAGGRIVAHGTEERRGFEKPTENQIKNSGGFLGQFEKILPTWYGFGIGIKDGKYYSIDFKNNKIISEMSRETLKTDLYCLFVKAEDYSGIPKGLKLNTEEAV